MTIKMYSYSDWWDFSWSILYTMEVDAWNAGLYIDRHFVIIKRRR